MPWVSTAALFSGKQKLTVYRLDKPLDNFYSQIEATFGPIDVDYRVAIPTSLVYRFGLQSV